MAHFAFRDRRALTILLVTSGLAPLSIILSLASGSVAIPWHELLAALLHRDPQSLTDQLVWQLRLPRTLTGFSVGGLLALAGALLQVLLRNPLADPYVLGTAGGAATCALTAILLGATGVFVDASAFLGALAATLLVLKLSATSLTFNTTRLLLTGVILSAGWSALISFILVISPQNDVSQMLFCLLGDLSRASHSGTGWLVLLVALLWAMLLAPSLNILARGELVAESLGVNLRWLQIQILCLASLLCGIAVSIAGTVGFVGLITPHLLRLAGVSDQRWLLPTSALLGGTLVVVSDILARTLIAPQQLPLGVITAWLGIPVFLFLLRRRLY